MTTFICSLFLPYTIDFDASDTPGNTGGTRSPVEPPPLPRQPSTIGVPQVPLSLFAVNTPLATPSYSTNVDPFSNAFSKQEGVAAEKLKPLRPLNPRQLTLARTEAHVPEWGRSRHFNQPRAKVGDVPSSTILQYAKSQDTSNEEAYKQLKKMQAPRHRSKSRSRYDRSGWKVQNAVQGNGALTNAIKAAAEHGNLEHVSWVGTLGFPTDQLASDRKTEIDEKLENEYDTLAVWVKDQDFDGHYTHYCHTILWPIFHYQVPDHPKSKAFEDHSWKYYVKVNEAFAERVVKSYKHGDTVWIHDYHLLLVPDLIRKKIPEARIGFFLHTAFPSSEVFRCLAVRKQLLEGVLGANLIVFQAPEYAHHFLTTCSRLLVLEATEDGVQLDDHFVNVTSVPMGIVPDQLQAEREEDEVKEWIQTLQEKYKDKRVLVARDKVDNIRGVRQKLLSYELFLKKNPEWVQKVVLIQVATSTDIDKEVERSISEIVTRIDAQFSSLAHQPLVFLKQDIAYQQYLALMSFSDILILTPLRDGMNLTGHEFIVCQDGKGTEGTSAKEKKHGPMIISEFTGSATIFEGSEMSVNPWDYCQVARAIKDALTMDEEERDRRYDQALEAVLTKNADKWVEQLRTRLITAYEGHKNRGIMNVPRLSVNNLIKQYNDSQNRLFILDYEGTLAHWDQPSEAVMSSPQRVIDTMVNLLAASNGNIVYVTSGRAPDELEHIFRQVPGIGLIAENGCFVRPFTTAFQAEDWIDLSDSSKCDAWKPGVLNILKYYEERLEGAWTEERACSIIFHYDNVHGDVGAEAANRQAGECANHINDSCKSVRVKAVPVDTSVVVELMDHNKMTAAAWALRRETKRLSGSLSMPTSHRDSAVGLNNSPLEPSKDITLPIRAASPRRDDSKDYSPTSPPGVPVNYSQSPSTSYFDQRQIHGPAQPAQAATEDLHKTTTDPSSTVAPDFLMVGGDSRDDELMFRWANTVAEANEVKNVVSVYVGGAKGTTEATCTLSQGVTGLLTALNNIASL